MRSNSRPFLSIAPRSTTPIVLTCEHATNRLPFRARISPDERAVLDDHWGWDIGAWSLTQELARRLGTGAVGGRWSRLVIDLNRRVDEDGLIRHNADGVTLSWNSSVTFAEIERRMVAYHAPYHLEVDRQILRRAVRGVRPLLFAVHSFTPVYGNKRRDFEIGILYDRHAALARKLVRHLRDAGLTVRYNQPYSGKKGLMYSADRHGTHHDLPCLELEVNQGLFRRSNTVSRLGHAIAAGLQRLVNGSD